MSDSYTNSSKNLRPPFFADPYLALIVGALVIFGILMVYSTTGVVSQEKFGDSFYHVKKQIVAAIAGAVIMVGLRSMNIEIMRKYSPFLIFGAIGVLFLPLVPGLGVRAGGASRWLDFGFFRFQPAELAKLLFVIFFAGYLSRHENELQSLKAGVLKPLLLLLPMAALLLLQPDFGSSAVLSLVVIGMATVAGARLRYLLLGLLAMAVAGGLLVIVSPYRMSRVLSFLSPMADPAGRGYQLIQSLIAVSLGKVDGVGLGSSQQKLFFLPAAHTDFIFAVIAEELGFLGAMGVIGMFVAFLWRGLLMAGHMAEDTFYFSLAVGLTLLIAVPAFLNVGVVIGILPTKGMVLPFVGYGGSSLICCLALTGLLMALPQNFRKAH